MKMTLCRTKDGRYLRAPGREAAPEGAEAVEPARLNLGGLQAAISALAPLVVGLQAVEAGGEVAQGPPAYAVARQAGPVAARPLHPEFEKPSRGAAPRSQRLLWSRGSGLSTEVPG